MSKGSQRPVAADEWNEAAFDCEAIVNLSARFISHTACSGFTKAASGCRISPNAASSHSSTDTEVEGYLEVNAE